MAIEIKHQFISGKGDGSDTTLVRPSNWNEIHDIELASNTMIARLTAGDGPAEEYPVTPYMISLMGAAENLNELLLQLGLPSTGDAKLTMKTTADIGWVMMNDGTIGDLSSGATRANTDTVDLFTLLYNNCLDQYVSVYTSAGVLTTRAVQGSAATAYVAHCRIALPKQLGRAFLISGTGSGLTNHALGSTGGAETHVITGYESVGHYHRLSIQTMRSAPATDADRYLRVADVKADALAVDAASAGMPFPVMGDSSDSVVATTADSLPPTVTPYTTYNQETSGAIDDVTDGNIEFRSDPMSLMQPWAAWNVMIKL